MSDHMEANCEHVWVQVHVTPAAEKLMCHKCEKIETHTHDWQSKGESPKGTHWTCSCGAEQTRQAITLDPS